MATDDTDGSFLTDTDSTFEEVDEHIDEHRVRYFTSLLQSRKLMTPISSFTRPSTLGEASARIKQNLYYFRSNYAMFVLFIFWLRCLLYSGLMNFFVIFYSVQLLRCYFCHDDPIEVFNQIVDDHIILGFYGVVIVLFFIPSGACLNVLVFILIGFAIIVIHATFRGIEDLPSDEVLQDDNV